MFFRLRDAAHRIRFSLATRNILSTPPLALEPGPAEVLSLVRHADVPMYLLAIKSFYRRLGRGAVSVLADVDLGPEDRALIRRHVPGVRFSEIRDVPLGGCQSGGCWERLLHVADRTDDTYVIQLDSDVLTFGDISEILACVAQNRSFALGADGARVVPLLTAAEETPAYRHVINDACRAFTRMPGAEGLRYLVHGSAGLSGFARQGTPRARVEQFHHTMMGLLGDTWREWGSEQVASNFAVANAPEAMALPWPKYANHIPGQPVEAAECLHFFGTYRFHGGLFLKRAVAEIAAMEGRAAPAPRHRASATA